MPCGLPADKDIPIGRYGLSGVQSTNGARMAVEDFAAEKIVIPFPIRALNLDQEGARLERPNGEHPR